MYVLDGPVTTHADAEADARAVVRGLQSVGWGRGLDAGEDATGDGRADWLANEGDNTLLFDGGASGEQTPLDAAAVIGPGSAGSWSSPRPGAVADVDQDGVGDVIVGGAGAWVIHGPVAGAVTVDDATTSLSNGFGCRWALSTSDVDADGYPELLCDDLTGEVQIFDVSSPGMLTSDDALARVALPILLPYRIATAALAGGVGLAVTDPSDADGDGVVWIVPGPLTGTIDGADVGTAWPGAATAWLGESLAVGDLDGDGLDEVAAGAAEQGAWSGAVYVFGLD